jgi:polyphosphate kinase
MLDSRTYLTTQIFPALTPLAVGPAHPFPLVREGSLNIAVLIDGKTRDGLPLVAMIEIPPEFEHAAALVAEHASDLFPGFRVRETAAFRITAERELVLDSPASAQMIERLTSLLTRR